MEDEKELSFYREKIVAEDSGDERSASGEEDDNLNDKFTIKIELYNVIALQMSDFERGSFVNREKCGKNNCCGQLIFMYTDG